MKQKKILLIGSSKIHKDGWNTMSYGIYDELVRRGYKVIYLEGQNPNKNSQIFTLKLYSHIKYSVLNIFIDSLRVLIKKFSFRPDFVIIIPEPFALATFLSNLVPFHRCPYYIYTAGTYAMLMLNKRGYISRLSMKSASLIFSMSEYTKLRYRESNFREEIIVVKSGYNNKKYKKQKLKKDKKCSLIFVGNLKERKGFLTIVEALKLLRRSELKKINLNIVTSKFNLNISDYKKVLNDITNLKYKIFVNLGDHELSSLYAKSHLNLLPSISNDIFFEGFGIVHYEAIASGCITLGTDNSGNTCAIKKGNGFIIPQKDPIKLKYIIQKVLNKEINLCPNGPKISTWQDVVDKMISSIS